MSRVRSVWGLFMGFFFRDLDGSPTPPQPSFFGLRLKIFQSPEGELLACSEQDNLDMSGNGDQENCPHTHTHTHGPRDTLDGEKSPPPGDMSAQSRRDQGGRRKGVPGSLRGHRPAWGTDRAVIGAGKENP